MPIECFALALLREGSDFIVKITIKSHRGSANLLLFVLALLREGSDFVVEISIKSPRGSANRVFCFSFALGRFRFRCENLNKITPGECQSGVLF